MVHATPFTFLKQGLQPQRVGKASRQNVRLDLYLGQGTDPRAGAPNPRCHPCSKISSTRNVMIWVYWGADGTRESQALLRVAASGTILTHTLIPREHIYFAVRFDPDSLAMMVVAASQQACSDRLPIVEAFSRWGVLAWPDDAKQYLNNENIQIVEPFTVSEPPATYPGTTWSSPFTSAELALSDEEEVEAEEPWDAEGELRPDFIVDLEPSGDTDHEAWADDPAAPFSLSGEGAHPAAGTGAPPTDRDAAPPPGSDDEPDDGDDADKGGGAIRTRAKVERAWPPRPTGLPTPSTARAAPPWRDPPSPPRGRSTSRPSSAAPNRQRTGPAPAVRGSREAMKMRQGQPSSSSTGGQGAPQAYPALAPTDAEARRRLAAGLRVAAALRAVAAAQQELAGATAAQSHSTPPAGRPSPGASRRRRHCGRNVRQWFRQESTRKTNIYSTAPIFIVFYSLYAIIGLTFYF